MTLRNKSPEICEQKKTPLRFLSLCYLSYTHNLFLGIHAAVVETQSNMPKAHEKSRRNQLNGYEKLVMKLWQLVMKSSSGGKSR